MRKGILAAAALATLGLASTSANALTFNAPIGIDFTGTGTSFLYSNRWVELTDTGVDINPNGIGTIFNPGDVHTFQSQHRVGSFLDAAANPVAYPTLPFGAYQITQTVVFNDQVKTYTPNGTGGGTVEFQHLADAFSNMSIWLDNTSDGTAAVASGPGSVACYGAGTCGGAGGIDGDGIEIMRFNLVGNTSSFTSSVPGSGTGSYDLLFELTYFNPLYVDLTSGLGTIANLRFTGTLAQPLGGTPAPVAMWNGVSGVDNGTSPNQLFKIDGSKDFAAVPEPTSIALLGLGLAGLSLSRRRKV